MSDLWRDMDFALPAGHPSSWEQECKQLRVKLQEAESAVNWAEMTKNRAVDEAKALRARVAELENIVELADAAMKAADEITEALEEAMGQLSRVDELEKALEKCLDFIEDFEGNNDIELECGIASRAALKGTKT